MDISIQGLIDKALERKGDRISSGKYSPSSFGKCFRNQYWNRKNEPQSNPIDERTNRVFKAGNLFHEFVQEVIIANNHGTQAEVLIEDDDFKGYADLVMTDEVADLKSQHSKAFWYRKNLNWEELSPKLMCNILQVTFYAFKLSKKWARLVFISKDDLCIQEYPFEVSKYKEELNKELSTLKDFWSKQVLPPAIPRAYPDKDGRPAECKYCGWKDKCEKLEKK
jgi:hypothetical protein